MSYGIEVWEANGKKVFGVDRRSGLLVAMVTTGTAAGWSWSQSWPHLSGRTLRAVFLPSFQAWELDGANSPSITLTYPNGIPAASIYVPHAISRPFQAYIFAA